MIRRARTTSLAADADGPGESSGRIADSLAGRDSQFFRSRTAAAAGRRSRNDDSHSFHGDADRAIRDCLHATVRPGTLPDAQLSERGLRSRLPKLSHAAGGRRSERGATHQVTAHEFARPTPRSERRRGFLRKYIFSTDHKVVGLQYLFLALVGRDCGNHPLAADALPPGVAERASAVRERRRDDCRSNISRW